MSNNNESNSFKSNVAKPIKIIERTVNPDVFRRKRSLREKETLSNLAYRFGKKNIDEWNDFQRKINIYVFSLVHGIVMAVVYMLFYLNYLPIEDQGLKMFTFFSISLPLGLYLADLYQAVSIAIISILLWIFFVTVLISFPVLIGAIGGSGLGAMITNFPQLLEFLICLPFVAVFVLIVPSLLSEMKK